MYDCGEFECISPGPKIKKKGGCKVAPPKIGGQEPPVKLVLLVVGIAAMM